MNLGLKNKYVVVSGGASGIGKAIVTELLKEGAKPVVIDKDSIAPDAIAGNSKVKTYTCDLSDPLETEIVIGKINKEIKEIYGLVNNAGVNDGIGIADGVASFMASLSKNLVHYYQLTSGFVEKIKRSQGSIVNISSKVADTGQGGTSGYAAAKGAVNSLTREWALELAPHGVDVNCVIPAEVMTPQYEKWINSETDPLRINAILKKINLGKRLTSPNEVADFVVFLLSNINSHATGQLLHVDGGYTHLDDSKT